MGTTCVAVARFQGDRLELLPFVLSCRVFGYGIERGVLNHLKRVAAQRGLRRIVGRYVETPHNSPCKTFLADNGFRDEDGIWCYDVDGTPPVDVPWLRISVRTA
jgi:predicted enzyme involved in methoxymalonyl-ACP biosynthesis